MDISSNHQIFLGFDTSCYTTSLGIVDINGVVLKDLRRVLKVKSGGRGLRQSEALFQHVNNLPELLAEATEGGKGLNIKGVGFSARPRAQDDSYLPVFLAGANFGKALAFAAGVGFFAFTHQAGHIRAALADVASELLAEDQKFLGIHLSGGTTEVLMVRKKTSGFTVELLGGTTDLHAGQMIDRLGVAMGLPFPAGRHLELVAAQSSFAEGIEAARTDFTLPISVRDLSLSFSGPTTAGFRLLKQGVAYPDLAWAIQDCILRSVSTLVKKAVQFTGCTRVLLFGGVASNSHLRKGLLSSFPDLDLDLYFSRPGLSTDNAVGIALLAREQWSGE